MYYLDIHILTIQSLEKLKLIRIQIQTKKKGYVPVIFPVSNEIITNKEEYY